MGGRDHLGNLTNGLQHYRLLYLSNGSDPVLVFEKVKGAIPRDAYRLYKLIWDRFLACQMESQVLNVVSVDVEAGDYLFKASGHTVQFPGFTAVYEESTEEAEESTGKLPDLEKGEILTLEELSPEQHFTQPPPRYTEASVIKALEENGIGRPSTYAPTISTIQSREYVVKEGKSFKPTPLGIVTTGLMKDHFNDIVDVEFTANMEDNLDKVETGEVEWKKTVGEFYAGFDNELKKAEKDLGGQLFRVPDEESDEVCELCGRKMVIKNGRFGKFLACPGYPECKNTKPLIEDTGAKCPKCGDDKLEAIFSKVNIIQSRNSGAGECPNAHHCGSGCCHARG
jgi:DNA topoisomerase-1